MTLFNRATHETKIPIFVHFYFNIFQSVAGQTARRCYNYLLAWLSKAKTTNESVAAYLERGNRYPVKLFSPQSEAQS
jgi:hypothetical protein